MDNPSGAKDIIEATAKLAKEIPVYQDVAQPAAQQLGKDLVDVAKLLHVALAPVRGVVWGWDRIEEFVIERVGGKLKNVPAERIQPPDILVAGPALEALRFAGNEEVLREMYANLLATSLDSETAAKAHPTFVEILKNLKPDEARLLKIFGTDIEATCQPILEIRSSDNTPGFNIDARNFSVMGYEAHCQLPEQAPYYLDNLARLGLIERLKGESRMADKEAYKPLYESEDFKQLKAQIEKVGRKIETHHSGYMITDLGKLFREVCIMSKN